jgi:hypothetical protein
MQVFVSRSLSLSESSLLTRLCLESNQVADRDKRDLGCLLGNCTLRSWVAVPRVLAPSLRVADSTCLLLFGSTRHFKAQSLTFKRVRSFSMIPCHYQTRILTSKSRIAPKYDSSQDWLDLQNNSHQQSP